MLSEHFLSERALGRANEIRLDVMDGWMDADLLCKIGSRRKCKRERIDGMLDVSERMTHALAKVNKVSFMIAGQMSEPLVRRLIDGICLTAELLVLSFYSVHVISIFMMFRFFYFVCKPPTCAMMKM